MSNKKLDILIVGAGPAGIFACLEIIKKGFKGKIGLVEMGDRIEKRKKSDVMMGFGGGGTYSDGKLHYSPVLSHERALTLTSKTKYQKILDQIEETFKEFGVGADFFPKNPDEVRGFVEEAEKADIRLITRRIQHVGSDQLEIVTEKMQDFIEENGVELLSNVEVESLMVKNDQVVGVVDSKGNKIFADKILMVPGRAGAKWLQDVADEFGIKFKYGMVEVGVRVEFPESIMKRYAESLYEVVLKVRTKTFDDIMRIFCPCPNGYVAVENYRGYICVNGYSNSDYGSRNSNFAFLCEVNLTEPVENTIIYAKSIAELATTLGGGKPIVQRLSDLRKGRRSTWSRIEKALTEPSLRDSTPGDISMALPHRIVTNILEGLEKLDKVMPGINSGSTLLYAPEVKFRSSQIKTDKKLQSTLKNLFVAGDASGLSGSITGAAATGIMAARGMMTLK